MINRPIVATAPIPPETLEQGTLYTCNAGAIIWLEDDTTNIIPLGASRTKDGHYETTIAFGVGDPNLGAIGPVRLGETMTAPGVGSVTLVAFEDGSGSQLVTVLFIPEP
ncbi:MAG: hypothetical protein LBK42_05705 [Propionibacteriaceae bacterium]|jgi:hypothetical protein|nr:hypothetical protein [Propionibacteriaceae bacterium]